MVKGTAPVMSSESQLTKWQVRFTKVPMKPVSSLFKKTCRNIVRKYFDTQKRRYLPNN